jgi:Fur family ferric uptake transcriptional regulator
VDWADHASDELARAGYRRGGARAAVVDLLARQPCALSALEIEEALRRAGGRPVARASVYRVLDELERLKLVQRIDVGQGIMRYEALRPGGHHHHHLVCDECGEVIPFADDELERTIDRVARRVTFAVAEHEIVLHGCCGDCSAQPAATRGDAAART